MPSGGGQRRVYSKLGLVSYHVRGAKHGLSIIVHYGKSMLAEKAVFAQNRAMKSPGNAMLTADNQPFPSSVGLVLRRNGALVDTRSASSIARVHRILGFGEKEPLPTQAGMVRDTLKAIRRKTRQRQRQAAPLRLGEAMGEGQQAPEGVTLRALLAACAEDLPGLRDAALFSLAYDAGLRVSELVETQVEDLSQAGDGSGRLSIAHSKTDQEGQGALAWVSADTMARVCAWLLAAGIKEGPVFRRINVLSRPIAEGEQAIVRAFIGASALTRQGVVAILRRRVRAAIDLGLVELEPGSEAAVIAGLSAHSFRVGLTQDLFAAGEDGAGIALALRWSSSTTALRYARELAVGNNAAARVLGKLRSTM